MEYFYYYLLSVVFLMFLAIIVGYSITIKKYKARLIEQDKAIARLEAVKHIPSIPLGYDEALKVIDSTIDEIWKNKYYLYYRLKEIKIIPNMDEEAKNITIETIEAFDPKFLQSISNFYTIEYLTKYITRKSQIYLIEYTNTYKPNTK